MPIAVICPSCHARFSVSEKFAGKEGPCPKCKQKIKVPTLEEQVVIHAPETEKGKDKLGRPNLKATKREEAKFNPIVAGIIVGVTIAAFGVAFVMRGSVAPSKPEVKTPVKTAPSNALATANEPAITTIPPAPSPPLWTSVAGLAILGPLLVMAAYSFLRDAEIEPFRGLSLYSRVGLCAALYAGLWVAFTFFYAWQFTEEPPEVYQWVYLGPPFFLIGASIAWGCLELEFGNAFLHFSFYLLITMLLRLTMGLSAV